MWKRSSISKLRYAGACACGRCPPFVITSGYRCTAHNAEVGGVKQSAHMTGLAADIACPDSVTRLNILRGLIVAGFRRIGIGKNFIHCDVDVSKPNNVWLYGDR